jgi:hypothetical protein
LVGAKRIAPAGIEGYADERQLIAPIGIEIAPTRDR